MFVKGTSFNFLFLLSKSSSSSSNTKVITRLIESYGLLEDPIETPPPLNWLRHLIRVIHRMAPYGCSKGTPNKNMLKRIYTFAAKNTQDHCNPNVVSLFQYFILTNENQYKMRVFIDKIKTIYAALVHHSSASLKRQKPNYCYGC